MCDPKWMKKERFHSAEAVVGAEMTEVVPMVCGQRKMCIENQSRETPRSLVYCGHGTGTFPARLSRKSARVGSAQSLS